MTWEHELSEVLDDLEQQAEAAFAADREAELAERGQAEYARVTLASRLMASVGGSLTLVVTGVGPVSGRLERVAADWCLMHAGPGQEWIVRLAAVGTVRGASERSVPEAAWSPVARLGLGSALRRLAASSCVLHLLGGTTYVGDVRRVGADFVELGTGGTDGAGADVTLVAFEALAAVQRRD